MPWQFLLIQPEHHPHLVQSDHQIEARLSPKTKPSIGIVGFVKINLSFYIWYRCDLSKMSVHLLSDNQWILWFHPLFFPHLPVTRSKKVKSSIEYLVVGEWITVFTDSNIGTYWGFFISHPILNFMKIQLGI